MKEKKETPNQNAPAKFVRIAAETPVPVMVPASDDTPRERTILNPSTLLAPVPVALISCAGLPEAENAKPNLLTVAWAGTVNSEPPMVSISVRPSRYSHAQISATMEFVINLVDESLLKVTDYCGVKSGSSVDKFVTCQLNAIPAAGLAYAPAVMESPLTLSCKVSQILKLGTHDLFIAEVVAVEARSHLLDAQNRLRIDRARLVAYAHGDYYSLGAMIGFYGYSVASPDVLARRMPLAPGSSAATDLSDEQNEVTISDEMPDSRPPRRFEGDARPPRKFEGDARPPRRFEGDARPPRRFEGDSRPPRRFEGDARPPRKFEGEARPPRRFEGDARPPRQFEGDSRPPRRFEGDARPPRRFEGEARPPRRFEGDARPPRQFEGDSRPPRRFEGEARPPRKFEGDSRPPRRFEGGERPRQHDGGKPFHKHEPGRPYPRHDGGIRPRYPKKPPQSP